MDINIRLKGYGIILNDCTKVSEQCLWSKKRESLKQKEYLLHRVPKITFKNNYLNFGRNVNSQQCLVNIKISKATVLGGFTIRGRRALGAKNQSFCWTLLRNKHKMKSWHYYSVTVPLSACVGITTIGVNMRDNWIRHWKASNEEQPKVWECVENKPTAGQV